MSAKKTLDSTQQMTETQALDSTQQSLDIIEESKKVKAIVEKTMKGKGSKDKAIVEKVIVEKARKEKDFVEDTYRSL